MVSWYFLPGLALWGRIIAVTIIPAKCVVMAICSDRIFMVTTVAVLTCALHMKLTVIDMSRAGLVLAVDCRMKPADSFLFLSTDVWQDCLAVPEQ